MNDDLRIGGTLDRVLRIDGRDKLVIGDLKSGDVTFGILKIAQQLAVYAHSVLSNHETRARVPLGPGGEPVDLQRGVIIALNARTGACDLRWVDLTRGWDAVQLSKAVREWLTSGS